MWTSLAGGRELVPDAHGAGAMTAPPGWEYDRPVGNLAGVCILLAVSGCGVELDDRPVSFEYIATAILRPSCGGAACHSTQNQVGRDVPIVLDEPDRAYESLYPMLAPCTVGPGACDLGVPELTPALYQLITDPPRGVQREPLDAPLPQADIDLIGRWLVAGARNN